MPPTVAHGFRFLPEVSEGWVVTFTEDVAEAIGERSAAALERLKTLASDPVVPLASEGETRRLVALCRDLHEEHFLAREGHRIAVAHDVDSWMVALGALPLMAQPGEQFFYNTSIQVLGVLVARGAAGSDLGTVLRQHIFEPLGMRGTGFTVPADQVGRLPMFYASDLASGVLLGARRSHQQLVEHAAVVARWQRAGLDHRRRLVVRGDAPRGGTVRGTRVLSPESVASMTTDRLTRAQRGGGRLPRRQPRLGFGDGRASGREHGAAAVRLRLGWRERHHVAFQPAERRDRHPAAQRQANSPEPPPVIADFWAGINTALT